MIKHTRNKGNRVRRFNIAILEAQGYNVAIVERTGRFIFPKDMYNLFDLCAVNNKEIKFIQVTCNKPHSHKKLKDFSKIYPTTINEQWVWVDRKGFDVYVYIQGQMTRVKQ